MIEWISSNLKLVVSGILVVISVIVFILRKPNKRTLIDPSASSSLIDLVLDAENKFGSGHGKEKLTYVLDKFCEHLSMPKDDAAWVRAVLTDLIEKILSTPQKK